MLCKGMDYKNCKYSYSMQAIDLIVGEIQKNPESIVDMLKSAKK